jgi:hypothetical protein
MDFKLPPPAWQPLDEVRKKWKADEKDLLKFAAAGSLRLHAFVNPYSPTHFRREGRSELWVATTPVVVTDEIAGRLIHESFIDVSDWKTKGGQQWEEAIGVYGSKLRISTSDLVVFRDEIERFEAVHSSPVTHTQATNQLKDSEREKLLRHIGGLALLLAERSNLYRNGDAPNANQIAEGVTDLLKNIPDSNLRACGFTSLRTSIAKGVELLKK